VLTFASAPDFDSPTDANGDNVYVVDVQASDGSLTDVQTISVTVTNANEAPIITSNGGGSTASLNMAEGVTAVTTVTASDPDAGTTLTYSKSGGADAGKFNFNPFTRVLTFASAPNCETPADSNTDNVYVVELEVSDGTLTDTQTISVTITNIAPTADDVATSIDENSPLNMLVVAVEGIDPAGGPLVCSMISGNINNAFWINDIGQIRVDTPAEINYEAHASYTLIVRVSDGALSHDATVTIDINNLSEAPDFKPDDDPSTIGVNEDDVYTVELGRGQQVNDPIEGIHGNVLTSAEDSDGDTLTYTLVTGDTAIFDLNASTGAVMLKVPGVELADSSYTLEVSVSDGTLTDTATVNITVADSVGVAGDTHAIEATSDDLTVKFVRYALDPDNTTLTVTYTITWISANSADLTATQAKTGFLTGTFTFQATEREHSFTLSAVDDQAREGIERFLVVVDKPADNSYFPVTTSTDIDKKQDVDSFPALYWRSQISNAIRGAVLIAKSM
jgi:serralysin